jgi:hypothetical protein
MEEEKKIMVQDISDIPLIKKQTICQRNFKEQNKRISLNIDDQKREQKENIDQFCKKNSLIVC